MAEVQRIDADQNRLFTDIGHIDYNQLVLAMGGDTNYFGSKSIEHYAAPMKTVSEALYIRNKVISNYERAISIEKVEHRKYLMNVVIVGGGPTGVELAGAMAELRNNVLPIDYPELNFHNMKVVLIEGGPELLGSMSPQSKSHALKYLHELGVEVMLNTQVKDYNGQIVTLSDDIFLETQTLLWAAGIKPNRIDGLAAEHYAPNGRIYVDSYSQIIDCPNVYALGDVSLLAEEKYPKGHPQVAQVALQQAESLANNLIDSQKGKALKPFRYRDLGSMATIGKKRAVVDLPFIKFQGQLAWLTWLFVHLMAILGVKNRLFVFLNWSWNYLSFDPSLRLLIKPKYVRESERKELIEQK
jgi:NADH dehydrogenase